MATSRLSRSLRAYIRRRKAEIRRGPGDQEAAVVALVRQFPRPQRTEKAGKRLARPHPTPTPVR
jgi:hypothetical protein